MTPPALHHPELEDLYRYDLRIPAEKVEAILRLPRQTLVEDLKAILRDAVNRYAFFKEKEWKQEEMTFPIHALWLLADLKDESALPEVLNLLRQEREIIDLWIFDFVHEDMWEVIFHLGQHSLDELKAFVLEPLPDSFAQLPATDAVVQLAFHFPERREECIAWFRDILERLLLRHEAEESALDGDFISFFVGNLINIQAVELLPLIKRLYELDLVYEGIIGPYEDAESDITSTTIKKSKQVVWNTIFERYQHATSTWYSYEEDNEAENNFLEIPPPQFSTSRFQPSIRKAPKVGRNDPCPCGSGKKYKKCCWAKDQIPNNPTT
jgi:hypothetical protein